MHTQKIAISVPKELVVIVDEISKEKGISRSNYISGVLREKIMDQKDKELIDVYNRVFSDESIRKEQIETCEWFEQTSDNEILKLPGNIVLKKGEANLPKECVINTTQIKSVDKTSLKEKIGALTDKRISEVYEGMKLVMGFPS